MSLTPGGTQITATWTAPTDNGDTITGYTLVYRDPTTETAEWIPHTTTNTDVTRTITGLTPPTEYEVRVKATNSQGDSRWSEVVSQIAGAPVAPVINLPTPGDGQATVTWAAPTSNNGDAVIDYDVDHRSSTSSYWNPWTPDTTDVNDDPSDSSTLETALTRDVSGLTNGTLYEIRVRAQSGRGESPWSSTRQVRAGVPLAPTGLTLTAGNLHIVANWTAPTSDNGGTITEYVVVYRPTGGSWVTTSVTGTPPVTTVTLSSLTNGTTYEVFVRAENTHGIGAPSDTVTATPTTTKPGKPTLSLAAADGQLTASWSVDNGGETISLPTEYTITGLTNGTSYDVQVRATNSVGDGDWTATESETPVTVPDAPSLSVTAGDQQLTATWSVADDGGSAITDYDIEYREKTTPAPTWTDVPDQGANTSYVIQNLTNDTTYEVRVHATNAEGDSDYSAIVEGTPGTATEPGVPVFALTPGNGSISVSWTVNDGGSPVTLQRVKFRVAGETSDTRRNLGSWLRSYTIDGLTNSTPYEVALRARNAIGWGLWSDWQAATPLPMPGRPVVTLTPGDSQFTATWPAPNDNGSTVNLLRSRYRALASGEASTCAPSNPADWVRRNLAAGVLTETVTGLTNGTSYEYQVRARNSHGWGDWSGCAIAAVGAPSAPVVTLVAGDAKIDVSWTVPANHGSEITRYKVDYRVQADPPVAWITQAILMGPPPPDTSYELTGLANHTTYEVRVQARNSYGDSPWSQAKSATPGGIAPGVPGAPGVPSVSAGEGVTNGSSYDVEVRATNSLGDGDWSATVSATPIPSGTVPGAPIDLALTAGDTQIVAVWGVPATNGGQPISGYDVRCKLSAQPDSSYGICAGDVPGLTATLTGLTNGSGYDVQVRAKNSVGNGAWSPVASATPNPSATAPGRPVVSLSAGNGRITASWSSPASDGADISDYDVRYRESGASGWDDWDHIGTQRTTIITGLRNGSTYEVQVRATNSAGSGNWSNTKSARPRAPAPPPSTGGGGGGFTGGGGGVSASVPGAPGGVTLVAGAGEITVSWDAPTSTGGAAISGYVVAWRPSDSAGWNQASTTSATRRSLSVDRYGGDPLVVGTLYEVRVRAINSADRGAWSDIASVTLTVGGRFVDDDGSVHEANIEAIAHAGITADATAQNRCSVPTIT